MNLRWWPLVLIVILIPVTVSAEQFSLDPCAGAVETTEDSANFYLSSECFDVTFPKDYHSSIAFYDKYNDNLFDVKLMSLIDSNSANPNQKNTISLASLGLTASAIANGIVYTSPDSNLQVGYKIIDGQLKAILQVTDWESSFDSGILILRTRVHKEDRANAHIGNYAPVIDSSPSPLIIKSVIEGQNQFLEQQLFVGKSFSFLVLDPVYVLDYSPSPGQYLKNGTVATTADTGFQYTLNITAGLSDNSTATSYMVNTKYFVTGGQQMMVNYKFDETSGTVMYDSIYHNNGGYNNSPTLTASGVSNTAVYFNGVNQYATSYNNGSFNVLSTEKFGICFSINASNDFKNTERVFDWMGSTGFNVMGEDDEIRFDVTRTGGGAQTIKGIKQLDDSKWHTVCMFDRLSNSTIWVDGLLDKAENDVKSGTVTFPSYLLYGTDDSLSQWFDGGLDSFCFFKGTNLNVTGIVSRYNATKSCDILNPQLAMGKAIKAKYTPTYNSSFNWSLAIRRTTGSSSPIYIHAYDSDTAVSTTKVSSTIAGSTGFYLYNVSGLMNYMTYTKNISYSEFRIYTSTPINISDIFLVQYTADNNAPSVTSCNLNDTTPDCDQNVLLSCIITDNLAVNNVYYMVNGTNHSTSNIGSNYSAVYALAGTANNTLYDWEYVFAFDLVGNLNTTDPVLSFTYDCCYEDWQAMYGSCLINDSRFKYYIDGNSCGTTKYVPGDNGTYVACNYCDSDVQSVLYSDCYFNDSQEIKNFTYVDLNYASCCAVTGIVSDCMTDYYPYNETGYEACHVMERDFDIDIDNELYFGFGIGGLKSDKIYGKYYLNGTNPNSTYKCVSYVETLMNEVVQTNPPYTKRSDGITIWQKEIEDREFFTSEYGLGTVYWTNHNLVIDGREYIFGIECASENGDLLMSELNATVNYEPVNAPITRFFWLRENINGLMIALLAFVIVVFIIAWAIHQVRR